MIDLYCYILAEEIQNTVEHFYPVPSFKLSVPNPRGLLK